MQHYKIKHLRTILHYFPASRHSRKQHCSSISSFMQFYPIIDQGKTNVALVATSRFWEQVFFHHKVHHNKKDAAHHHLRHLAPSVQYEAHHHECTSNIGNRFSWCGFSSSAIRHNRANYRWPLTKTNVMVALHRRSTIGKAVKTLYATSISLRNAPMFQYSPLVLWLYYGSCGYGNRYYVANCNRLIFCGALFLELCKYWMQHGAMFQNTPYL